MAHWVLGVGCSAIGDWRLARGVFGWWGGAGVRGRPSKVKGAFGVAARWTSSTLDFGASAAPEAAIAAGSARPAPPPRPPPRPRPPPPPSVRYEASTRSL